MDSASLIVLTPVYNGADVLPEFLERCAAQDMPYYHIFVTNNCVDKSNELIDKYLEGTNGLRFSWDYPPDFTTRTTPYTGLAVARQVGINLAKKRDLAGLLLTDDDTMPVEDDAFSSIVSFGDAVDIIGGSYLRIWPQGIAMCAKWREDNIIFSYKQRIPLSEPLVTSGGFLLLSRKVLFEDWFKWYPIYRPSEDYPFPVADDFGFCLRARANGYRIFLDGTITLKHVIRPRSRPWDVDPETLEYPDFTFTRPGSMKI